MDEHYGYDEYSASDEQLAPRPGGSLLDMLRGRLGNVRIHSDSLANDLARRLGARAFTLGRDVYVRPDLVAPMNVQSEALLAHELFHVSEQTGVNVEMPLLRPSAPLIGSSRLAGSWSSRSRGGLSVQRAPANQPAPASLSSSEVAAEAIAAQVATAALGEPTGERAAAKPPDPQDVADKVYALMARDLVLDRERAAYGW